MHSPGSVRAGDPSELAGEDQRSAGPQGLTLTLLGDYVLPRIEPIWSGGLVRLLEELEITTASARLGLSRLARKGLIERSRNGRHTYYSLSPAGVRLLKEGQRRIFSFGVESSWDGTWTIVSYSVPEDRRAIRGRLRKRLAFLGFRSMRDGTWFSPRNRATVVAELLTELNLDANAEIFVARPSDHTDVAKLIARGWDLEQSRALYARFVARFSPYTTPSSQAKLTERAAFVLRTRVMHAFRRFPGLDPELPEEIVGEHWQRAEAIQAFHDIWDGLAAAATRHFVEITTP